MSYQRHDNANAYRQPSSGPTGQPAAAMVPTQRLTIKDMEALDTSALLKLREDCERAIICVKQVMLARAHEEIARIAKAAGLEIRDLVPKRARADKTGTYVDPSNANNIWTGRGRPPTWLKDYLKTGRKIEEFFCP